MSSDNYLFHGNDLGSVLHAHHQKMIDEIDTMEPDYLLDISTETDSA
jgi:hypothetical protein